jgi:hypothetical protein
VPLLALIAVTAAKATLAAPTMEDMRASLACPG